MGTHGDRTARLPRYALLPIEAGEAQSLGCSASPLPEKVCCQVPLEVFLYCSLLLAAVVGAFVISAAIGMLAASLWAAPRAHRAAPHRPRSLLRTGPPEVPVERAGYAPPRGSRRIVRAVRIAGERGLVRWSSDH